MRNVPYLVLVSEAPFVGMLDSHTVLVCLAPSVKLMLITVNNSSDIMYDTNIYYTWNNLGKMSEVEFRLSFFKLLRKLRR